ncbi:hypothetical protein D3C86_1712750 [compost metagenome]
MFKAAAERVTMDRRDDRLAAPRDGGCTRSRGNRACSAELADVGARHEISADTNENERLYGRVRIADGKRIHDAFADPRA